MLYLNELSRVFRSSLPEMPAFQFLPKPAKVTEMSEESTERVLWFEDAVLRVLKIICCL